MHRLVIFGATGRMGQTLIRALRDTDLAAAFSLHGAVASGSSQRLGGEAALEGPATGILVSADPAAALRGADVAIDFSLPASVGAHAAACVAAKVPLLIGATGFDAAGRASLTVASATIPLLIAPNTSVGVTVMADLVRLATASLGEVYDVDISEAHHRMKRDAPSGTAIALGSVVAGVRGRELDDVAVFERHGNLGPRAAGDIGFAVLRAGDIVGEHTVTFAAGGERLEITHRATDRITFARGALRAAAWLTGRPPGLYSMSDVLRVDQA